MLGISTRLPFRKQAGNHKRLVEKAAHEAERGRRLAIHDRDTGLCAYWYICQRFDEEAKRSERYSRTLSLMVVEVSHKSGFLSRDKVTSWLSQSTRASDLACHLGDGRYLVLMPETDADAASLIARRLQDDVAGDAAVGLSIFPEDGTTIADLQAFATRCLTLSSGSSRVAC